MPPDAIARKLRQPIGVAFASVILSATVASAQIFSPGSRTLFARAWMVRTDLVVVRAATLLRDGEKALDPADRKATATVTGRFHPQRAHELAAAAAGLTVEKFQVR